MKKLAFVLVLLMALLQGFYAFFAFFDPVEFANMRGAVIVSNYDIVWMQVYASRTLFIALIVATLLYFKQYKLLLFAALFGTIMPIADGYLAYRTQASEGIIAKHIATVVYLLITAFVLFRVVAQDSASEQK